jgi:predicted DNA-binding ribbon-helix-helix protein
MSTGRAHIPCRRINLFGHQTSVCLEPQFWGLLRRVAAECGFASAKVLIESIFIAKSPRQSLSSAIRVYVAAYFANTAPHNAMVDPTSKLAVRLGPVDRYQRRSRSAMQAITDPGAISDGARPPRPKAA